MTRRGACLALAGAAMLTGCEKLGFVTPQSGQSDGKTDGKGDGKAPGGPPKESPQSTAELRLDYAIILDSNGTTKRVSDKNHFESGDRFRIDVKPSFPAHLYLLNRGPRQANYTFLYPNDKTAWDNPLQPDRIVSLPGGQDWFQMDSKAGVESLTLLAAAFPLEEFNTPEKSIPRDEFEERLALVERDYRPASSRRFEDKDWVKLFAAREAKTVILLRLPLDHR